MRSCFSRWVMWPGFITKWTFWTWYWLYPIVYCKPFASGVNMSLPCIRKAKIYHQIWATNEIYTCINNLNERSLGPLHFARKWEMSYLICSFLDFKTSPLTNVALYRCESWSVSVFSQNQLQGSWYYQIRWC